MSTEGPEFPVESGSCEPPKPPQAQRPARRLKLPRPIALPGMRLRVSERRALLFVVDVLLVNVALFFAIRLGLNLAPSIAQSWFAVRWYLTLTAVWILAALFFDCYNLAQAAWSVRSVPYGVLAALSAALLYTAIPVLTPPLETRRYVFYLLLFMVGAIAAWRAFYAQVFVQPWFEQRALVVGAGWSGRTLVQALRTSSASPNPYRGTGYELVGFVDDDPEFQNAVVEGLPVLGDHHHLREIAAAHQVNEIIVAITHRHAINPDLFAALLECQERGFRLITMPVLYERLLGRVPVEHIGRDLQMLVWMGDSAGERVYTLLKRIVDLVLALLGLVALGVLVPFVALINALTCPGPLFYRQERVGQRGKPYWMIKFRSMVPDAEKGTGAVWACEGDKRITWIGRALRKTRLDELPQVLNVLLGEMSVIGPRPERPEFVEQLARELPFYRARHALRPGITGWAQVQFDYGNSMQDALVKLEYDLYYIKHASLLLDLRILLRTVSVMVLLKGVWAAWRAFCSSPRYCPIHSMPVPRFARIMCCGTWRSSTRLRWSPSSARMTARKLWRIWRPSAAPCTPSRCSAPSCATCARG